MKIILINFFLITLLINVAYCNWLSSDWVAEIWREVKEAFSSCPSPSTVANFSLASVNILFMLY